MLDRMVAARTLGNVKVAELVRRGLVVGLKLFVAALLPLLLLWAPAVACLLAGPFVLDLTRQEASLALLAGQGLLGAFSLMTTPVLAAALAAAAIRTGGGARLATREVLGSAFGAMKATGAAALATGVLTLLGLGALILPGLLATAVWFVVGPAAAVERLGFQAALRRSAELTRGNRWVLLGAALFLGALERLLLRFADMFFSERGRQSDVPLDLLVPLLISLVVIAFVTVLRAATAALAYQDLRITSEGLEIDALVVELGGAGSSLADAALSAREIDAMGARRKRLGKLTGQSEGGAEAAAASVRDLETMAAQRDRRRRRVGATIGALALLGVLGAVAYSIVLRQQQARLLDEQEREIAAAWTAFEASTARPLRGGDEDPGTDPFGGRRGAIEEKIERDRISRTLVSHVSRAAGPLQKPLLHRLMVVHAPHLYGEDFAPVFAAMRDGGSDEAILAALGPLAEESGCSATLAEARALPQKQAHAFAGGCPPGGPVVLHPMKLEAKTPFTAGVFATLLAIRAKRRDVEKDAAHELVMKALLGTRS